MNNIKRQITRNRRGIGIIFLGILGAFFFNLLSIADVPSSCAADATVAANSTAKVEIRADGTTMVNGSPFFPLGFYHVSWESTPDERMNALKDIGAAGFNTIHASATNLEDYGKFLDEAEKLGVYVISEQSVGLVNFVNAFKDKPAVLGWNIADDVDDGKLTPDDVLKFYQQAKASDPNHFTYVSGYTNEIKRFANCSDVIGMQSYPIKSGTAEELSSAYYRLSVARDAAAKFNRGFYGNLQTFSWLEQDPQKYPGARAPTFNEVRNMTYQALLAGAKGIIYYTYYDSDWNLPTHPDLWEGIKSLVPEVKAISSILLNGNLKTIDVDVKNVLAGIWQEQNEVLAVIINTSYENGKEVAIELPVNVSSAQPMFPDRPSGMVINGNKLSGSIGPMDVHVYKLSL